MGARGSAAKCPRPTRSEECSSCFGIVGARRRRGRLHPTRPVVYQRRRAVGRWAVRDVPRADESRSPAALDKPDVRVGAPVPLQARLPTTKNRSTLSVSYAVDCASLLLLGPRSHDAGGWSGRVVAIHFESTEPGDRPPPWPVAEGIPTPLSADCLAQDRPAGGVRRPCSDGSVATGESRRRATSFRWPRKWGSSIGLAPRRCARPAASCLLGAPNSRLPPDSE